MLYINICNFIGDYAIRKGVTKTPLVIHWDIIKNAATLHLWIRELTNKTRLIYHLNARYFLNVDNICSEKYQTKETNKVLICT